MRINNYTVVSILILQELEQAEELLLLRELASRLNVSLDLANFAMSALKRAGYVESLMGHAGGYRRVRSAKEIPLPEFIEKLEGLPPNDANDGAEVRMVRDKFRGLLKGTVADYFTKQVRTRFPRERPEMLNVHQVAEALGVSDTCVYLMASEGRLPPPRMISRRQMWPRDAVEEIAQKRQEDEMAHARTTCKNCGRRVIPYQVRFQATRMHVRGYPEDVILKVMPLCQPCTTQWMREHAKGARATECAKPVRKDRSDLLNVHQVAEALGVGTPHVYAMVFKGRLPPPEIVNYRKMWPKDAIAKIIRERQERLMAHVHSTCKGCERDISASQVRVQAIRMRTRGYPEDMIKEATPRCGPCITQWMRAHEGLRGSGTTLSCDDGCGNRGDIPESGT